MSNALDLARKLERERDEWVAKTAELSSERDEARRLAEQFASGHDVIFYWENVEPRMASTPTTQSDGLCRRL